MVTGILLLDKPLGLSSNSALQRVKRLLKADKVELRATAVVEGAIQAQMIVIADGAFYKGDIQGTGAGSAPPLLRDRRHYEPDPSRER